MNAKIFLGHVGKLILQTLVKDWVMYPMFLQEPVISCCFLSVTEAVLPAGCLRLPCFE